MSEYCPSLNEATQEELIDELGRRSNCVLVVISREVPGKIGDEQDGASTHWRGGWVGALGLMEFGRADLRRMLLPRSENRTTE